MSYLTVNIGGKERGVAFGNVFREELGKLYSKDPLEAVEQLRDTWGQSYTIAAIDIFYCGMRADCLLSRQSIDFDLNQVSRWFDDATDAQIAPILQAFLKSQADRPIIKMNGTEEGEAKKKSLGKKSKTSQ